MPESQYIYKYSKTEQLKSSPLKWVLADPVLRINLHKYHWTGYFFVFCNKKKTEASLENKYDYFLKIYFIENC